MKIAKTLFLIPFVLLTSCSKGMSYSDLLSDMKTHDEQIVMRNNYYNGNYYETGFFKNSSEIVVYHSIDTLASGYCIVYLRLPNSADVPNVFSCIYSNTFSNGDKEQASFYISNSYTTLSGVEFDLYTGIIKESAQDLADTMMEGLIFEFDTWTNNTYSVSLKNIGLFPYIG